MSPRTDSGVGEIRTHGTLAGSAVFKTAAFNHSATTPPGCKLPERNDFLKYCRRALALFSTPRSILLIVHCSPERREGGVLRRGLCALRDFAVEPAAGAGLACLQDFQGRAIKKIRFAGPRQPIPVMYHIAQQ